MTQFGKYEVLSDLGRGGTGRLYRAYDPLMAREVAIKVLDASSNERDLKRFRQEAAAVGSLQHRNIISTFEVGVQDGQPFLVMELLQGNDLSHFMHPGIGMQLLPAVEAMQQAAQGLLYAHTHGVVHRDVAPRNIWLVPDGTVKIIDFGIAGHERSNDATRRPDDPVGTVLYFSPEHLPDSAAPLDTRSDIFSFGSVFYELLSGRHPFAGDSDQEVLCNIQLHEPETLVNLVADCPEPLARIIQRALSKDLELRYPDLQELQLDLDPVLLRLRRQKAGMLVEEAECAFAEGRSEEARKAVGRALILSPDHEKARELHKTIQEQQHRSILLAKVTKYMKDADAKIEGRRFGEAVALLKLANQLAPEDPAVTVRLADARAALEINEMSASLVRQAEAHRLAMQLEEALKSARQALVLDPANQEASRLVESIRTQLEDQRKRRLGEGIVEAKQLLAKEQFHGAVILLEALALEFPEASQIVPLMLYGREEIRSRRRARVIDQVSDHARKLAAFGQFDAALGAIDQALQEFPGDSTLVHLLNAIKAAKTNHEGYRTNSTRATSAKARPQCECGSSLIEGTKFCDNCGRRIGP